jgi:hypothetical protein
MIFYCSPKHCDKIKDEARITGYIRIALKNLKQDFRIWHEFL